MNERAISSFFSGNGLSKIRSAMVHKKIPVEKQGHLSCIDRLIQFQLSTS
jgi:hypothetical protein